MKWHLKLIHTNKDDPWVCEEYSKDLCTNVDECSVLEYIDYWKLDFCIKNEKKREIKSKREKIRKPVRKLDVDYMRKRRREIHAILYFVGFSSLSNNMYHKIKEKKFLIKTLEPENSIALICVLQKRVRILPLCDSIRHTNYLR